MYRVQDKFVTGMRPGPILERLCEESPSKKIEDVLKIALNKEAALREQYRSSVEVNRVQKSYSASSGSSGFAKNSSSQFEKKFKKDENQEESKCNFCNKKLIQVVKLATSSNIVCNVNLNVAIPKRTYTRKQLFTKEESGSIEDWLNQPSTSRKQDDYKSTINF